MYMLLCGNEELEFSQGFSPGSDNGGRFGAVSGFGNSFKFTSVGIREDVGIGWAPVSGRHSIREGFARTCFIRSAHNMTIRLINKDTFGTKINSRSPTTNHSKQR